MSDAMGEFFGQMPERPDHPDFWRLSEIVLEVDGRLQAAQDEEAKNEVFNASIDAYVDRTSVVYLSLQRAFRVLGVSTRADLAGQMGEVSRLASVYLDGFLAGATFQARGGRQDSR